VNIHLHVKYSVEITVKKTTTRRMISQICATLLGRYCAFPLGAERPPIKPPIVRSNGIATFFFEVVSDCVVAVQDDKLQEAVVKRLAMFMMTLACNSSEYEIRGPSRTDGLKVGYLSWPRRGDRATVRLETISSFDFHPKTGFAPPTLEPTCPFSWPGFLLGQISGTAPRRSLHVLDRIQHPDIFYRHV
jgi:hypothetical protein